jgi:hypothetical protein
LPLPLKNRRIKGWNSRLGGVVVSVLATRPKGHGFKPGQFNGYVRAVKVHSKPSFRWEVKPEARFYGILKIS